MAKPSEVQQNVAVIKSMFASAQAGGEKSSDVASAAAHGFSEVEQQVLQQVHEILQPVKDVTWPVGLTGNRK